MSFSFTWPRFSDAFHVEAIEMLNGALNKGNKPRIIADKIEVVELEMGTQPPELEIRDIGDLTTDHFKGIFKLSYSGDAHIVLRTKVQANPLNHKKPDLDLLNPSRGIPASHQPLVVPMLLRLSHFRLNAYVVLVVSKQKGITLVFKTDPLQNVDVNSTFDSIAVIQKYIQREIEGQLREMFREDLPGIIHRLSQRWLPGRTKVETTYTEKVPRPLSRETMSSPDISTSRNLQGIGLRPTLAQLQTRHPALRQYPASAQSVTTAPRSVRAPSVRSISKPSSPPVTSVPEPYTTFSDLVDYDPTYGLRPEGLPTKSDYSGLGRLFGGNRGLGDLIEGNEGGSDAWGLDDDLDSRDGEWDDFVPDFSVASPEPSLPDESVLEYETIPAVGGGTITRPRIFHSQSRLQSPVEPHSASPRSSKSSRSGSNTPDIEEPHHGSKPSRSRRSLAHASTSLLPFSPSTQSPLQHGFSAADALPLADHPHSRYDPQASYFPPQPQSSHDLPSFSPSYPDWSRVSRSTNSASRQHEPHRRGHPPTSVKSAPASPPLSYRPSARSFPSSGSTFSIPTPPSTELEPLVDHHQRSLSPGVGVASPQIKHERKRSLSPSVTRAFDFGQFGSPPRSLHGLDGDTGIILHPGFNDTVTQLSALSHLNHTLSPYTRSLEHFTVRSVPRRHAHSSSSVPSGEKQKARRKRTFRLGSSKGQKTANSSPVTERTTSVSPPPDFSDEDVDHYFRPSDSYTEPLHMRMTPLHL